MKKIYLSPKMKKSLAIGAALLLCALLYLFFGSNSPVRAGSILKREEELGDVITGEYDGLGTDSEQEEERLGVHVGGAVLCPDVVYYFEDGQRVSDAIAAAGGTTEGADLSRINLAEKLWDGMKLYVPTVGEAAPEESETQNGKVNLNTAGRDELMSLPGIGEAYAERILEYRKTHGRFKSTKEITKVSGIGDKLYKKIKERLTV